MVGGLISQPLVLLSTAGSTGIRRSTAISLRGVVLPRHKQSPCTTLPRRPRSCGVVTAAFRPTWLRAVQAAWKVGRDGIEAGAKFVPETIPRPVAKVSVAVVAGIVTLFILKSLLSTAFFVLGVMGLVYFLFIAFNSEEGSKGDVSSSDSTMTEDEALQEARRIMEKYK